MLIVEEGNKDVQIIVADVREVVTIGIGVVTPNPDSLEYNFLVGVQLNLLVKSVVKEAEVVRFVVVVVVSRNWFYNVRPDVAVKGGITKASILVPGDVRLYSYPVITQVLH